MAATHFRCPRCRRMLEKGAAAFVLGSVGYAPKAEDPLPPSVTCPGCGFAIDTADMIAGRLDEKADWLSPLAVVLGLAAAFVSFYGFRRSGIAAVGIGFGVTFAIVGAADVAERLWASLKARR
ncbi:MAG: hypothetical protein HYZ75_00140 [Elusimicrobia bacterium]|nr:hypothetical protein [Elusimicrobiota bacterium]